MEKFTIQIFGKDDKILTYLKRNFLPGFTFDYFNNDLEWVKSEYFFEKEKEFEDYSDAKNYLQTLISHLTHAEINIRRARILFPVHDDLSIHIQKSLSIESIWKATTHKLDAGYPICQDADSRKFMYFNVTYDMNEFLRFIRVENNLGHTTKNVRCCLLDTFPNADKGWFQSYLEAQKY